MILGTAGLSSRTGAEPVRQTTRTIRAVYGSISSTDPVSNRSIDSAPSVAVLCPRSYAQSF